VLEPKQRLLERGDLLPQHPNGEVDGAPTGAERQRRHPKREQPVQQGRGKEDPPVNRKYFEAPTDPANRFTAHDLVGACYERDAWNVLFGDGALRPEFFDLSSGFAGEMVQKLANYGIRAGIVVADMSGCSDAFRSFAHESSRSGHARFFRSTADAIAWLSGPPS
jgi:hypothetical protein